MFFVFWIFRVSYLTVPLVLVLLHELVVVVRVRFECWLDRPSQRESTYG